MSNPRRTSIELQNRRKSSEKTNSTNNRASVSSSGNTSPIPTVASRSSSQSVVIVQPPSLLSPVRKKLKPGSSIKSDKSDKSAKSIKSNTSITKQKPRLTSSFLKRKREEYAGIILHNTSSNNIYYFQAENFYLFAKVTYVKRNCLGMRYKICNLR